MTLLLGVAVGLLLVPAWRAVSILRARRRAASIDVCSTERRQMFLRGGSV